MVVSSSARRTSRTRRHEPLGILRGGALFLAAVAALSTAHLPGAAASTVASATFSGGTGTATTGGVLYAKAGASLTLTVVTSSDTKCVQVSGAFASKQTSATAKSSWSFVTTAPAGEGTQAVTVAASPNFNANNCTGQTNSAQATYSADNTAPVVTGSLSPVANGAGWNSAPTTLTWSAADAGAGVASGPTPASSTESADGIVTRTSTATDKVGNTGSGSLTVRVDKAAPAITASQTTNPDRTVTVTFTCTDSGDSGIDTCLAAGSATNGVTVSQNGTVTGTAKDKAGNTKSTSVDVTVKDSSAPLLSGTPTTQPNANGWYRDDVAVHWTASDPESGIPTDPADTTIGGEGTGLTSSQSVTNGDGLTTTTISSPAVKIDRTAPTTAVSGGSNTWTNGSVTLSLAAADNLSGVVSTHYTVDSGSTQAGTEVTVSDEGSHTVQAWSTDKAGNTEQKQSFTVRIDKTAPTIGHSFTPAGYADGSWTNGQVTVTFDCADQGGADVASCTSPVTKSAEGSHTVTGTAADGAGNTATDQASVRIDLTKPTITATVVGDKNAAGWYRDDVTVLYSADDALSGVSGSPKADTIGEGANQSRSASVTDAAGNTVLSASFSGGWHSGDVTVTWSCTDALSGVATPPSDDVVTGEGETLTSSASCVDRAGNVATKTVGGITIDRHAPVTTASAPAAPASGWYTGAVPVTLDATDNLSGKVSTSYTVDDGDETDYTGEFSVSGNGVHEVRFHSTDAAGNVEQFGAPLVLRIDGKAPSTTVTNPIVPDSGWFVTSGVPFSFVATDADSGVAATYYTVDGGDPQTYGEPFTADLSTGVHTVIYWSVDVAGNAEDKASTTVRVDLIAPTITGKRSPQPNANGWNNTDVDVTFTCSDADSGIDGVAGCAGDTTLKNEGFAQSVHGDAVDVAGNRSGADVAPINIDKTKPTLVGVVDDPNGAGWYRGDVTVTWVADDDLSKIDTATQPAASVVSGEGSNLAAGPVSVADRAGNTASASVSGIKIDRTAPTVKGGPTTQPNAAGWYRDEVLVDFTCFDALSGVAFCPTSKLVKGDGASQSVTSDSPKDIAGNVGSGKTVSGINIDGTAPATTANNLCTATNGYCTGSNADVELTATDQAGLSGVKEIHYKVDGGTETVTAAAKTTVQVPLSGSGAGTVSYWAVDKAGNVEKPNSVALKWDNIAPTVDHSLSPVPNADDWNKADVTVTFSAKDDDKGSGVGSVTAPVTVSAETAGQLIAGKATDTAGNVGTDQVTVKLDKTAPVISAAVTKGTKTASGWYAGPVTVTFTCSDGLSGVATCPDPVVLSANGSNATSGVATDKAGNTAATVLSGITIDQEKPTLTTAGVNVAGGTYLLGTAPAPTCTATDSFSGVASCVVTVTGGNANGVGTFAFTATATDRAGNVNSVTGSYRVIYRFDGFLQPINDTAHQVGTSTSVFKAGSTVPTKFQLKRADGSVLAAVGAPAWLTPAKGSSMSAPVDESVYSAAADSGSTFKYDSAAQQYLYNYKSGTGGNYWRIGVSLEDGQTYSANIGLR